MGTKKKLGKPLIALIIAGLIFVFISALHLLGVFHYLEYKSYDLRVRFWAESSYSRPSDEIAVIVLDQDSVDWAQQERAWGWPWPRQAYAEIVEFLNIAGAKSVAFDILYTEPSVYRHANQDEIIDSAVRSLEEAEDESDEEQEHENEGRGNAGRANEGRGEGRGNEGRGTGRPSDHQMGGQSRQGFRSVINALRSLSARHDDASFIDASNEFGRVVQAVMFSSQTGTVNRWPSQYSLPLFQPEGFGDMLQRFSVGEDEKGQFPIPGLIESAGALGSVTGIPDSDGVYRRLKPFTLFDGKAVPGLSTASFLISGMEPLITYDEKKGILQWEHISIPVNKDGFALLRFRGDFEKYIPYKASHILQSLEALKNGKEPLLDPSYFKDTYIFVGVYGQGFFDIFPTPISSLYPGVGAHVTMLDNLLAGDFIRESNEWFNLAVLLAVVAVIVSLAMFSSRMPVSLTGTAIIIIAIIVYSFAAYQFGGLWVSMVTYLAGALISFITVILYNFATEGSQKRFIKSAFSQYLSPKVIEQIIQDPSQLKLGGEKREMTAIFTDVRGFSTFSEALGDPTKLVELLNFYLTKMSNIVLDNQGTIDKYEGDAIIAFFGAPVHFKNHASLACRAAVRMKKAEPDINREAISSGLVTPGVMEAMFKKGLTGSLDDLCQIFTRIGMNTGDMVVGNMGTPNKMDYTIMGNAVNLAARLEGVNKQYNTGGILISEYTRAHIGDEFILRPLSRVRVVGINTPLRLYELLDIAEEASPQLLEMVKNWTQAFDLYEARNFAAARDVFQSIFNKNTGDFACKKYLDRCIKFTGSPPDEKAWDNGVDNLTEK